MRAIIVEDERLAADNLMKILIQIGTIEVVTILDSVSETVDWFRKNEIPEILFLDIHLADGYAFEIFEMVEINCPVVFTTAYDEYALKAFKVNSIDYLLKPLDIISVRNSLEKHKRLTAQSLNPVSELKNLIGFFKKQSSYKSNFLVPSKGDKLIPLNTDDVMYFFIDYGTVKAVTDEGNSLKIDKTLDEISELLNPEMFFRINRQVIISRKAIKDIDLWFNQRLSLNLNVTAPGKIIISKARIPEFKEWFTKGV